MVVRKDVMRDEKLGRMVVMWVVNSVNLSAHKKARRSEFE